MLLSSTGVSVDFHVCQNKIKSFSIFGEAKKCSAMEKSNSCSSQPQDHAVSKTKCCTNTSIHKSATLDTDIQVPKSTKTTSDTILASEQCYTALSYQVTPHIINPPPVKHRSQDVIVANQVFLI